MATAVEFACPSCQAECSSPSRPGELVRCPNCFSFITVPDDDRPQVKATPPPEPPSIIFRCPYCESRIQTDEANAGLPCLCPGCHVGLTIPGNAAPIFLRPPPSRETQPQRLNLERVPTWILLAILTIATLYIVGLASTLRP